MKGFQYNWATAEMVKLYLRNSRAQEARKARATPEVSADTQDTPTNNDVGISHANIDSDSDSSSDSSSDENE